jgi:hypothetical protein
MKTQFNRLILMLTFAITIQCIANAKKQNTVPVWAEISILGTDTNYNADSILKGHKSGVISTENLKGGPLLTELGNYTKWKKSPNYKCVPNLHIVLHYDDATATVNIEVSISECCAFAKYYQNGKAKYCKIPSKILGQLQTVYEKAPNKNGWIKL